MGWRGWDVPMRGWAINPLMGPANHTSDVSCSDNPKVNKNGVPYLPTKSVSNPGKLRDVTKAKRERGKEHETV